MDSGLTNRLALVSGSTAGIGYAIAAALCAEGARAIVNGRTQGAVDKAVASIGVKTGNAPLGFAGDLSRAEEAQRLVREFPDVQILVNNLGIFEPKPFEEIPDADWGQILTRGHFFQQPSQGRSGPPRLKGRDAA
jgi:NAD(P)-dependent dehydrogenase (short-subunit alcohol dehydrogenase family)